MQVLERTEAAASVSFSGRSAAPVVAVTEDEARAELARIVDSADFPATSRNRKFLAYVVGRALQDPSGKSRVTAWDVAVRIFGRPESFNSILDPIVRIEAGKLRRDLETYYLKSGRGNPLRIDIPRGGYDPVFMRAMVEPEAAKAKPDPVTGRVEEDAMAEMRRILDSRDFPASERNRRFLAFVVENELQGALQEITPGNIGRKIFGRGASFDSNKDPIVRIEAARLRRDLETYYLKSGRHNPLRILIPKGGYRPAFAYDNA